MRPSPPASSSLASQPDRGGHEAFYHSPYPALVVPEDSDAVLANAAGEQLFGQGLKLLARSARGLGPAVAEGLAEDAAEARASGAPTRRRGVAVRLPDRQPFEADVTAAPLSAGRLLITFLPRAQAGPSERRADTLRTAAGMGRTLAHEVKNPLSGIRGAAQLLQASAAPEDVALAQLIIDETDRIRRLIDRVEAFSDPRALERRPVNIHRVLDRVRAVVAVGVGDWITLRETYDPSLPDVLGDQDQLVQLFLNLLKNAAEAANLREDGRGEILISTQWRHRVGHAARSGRIGAPLEVSISDNGPGVAPALREQLFEPFITTKTQGAGLGLTLVAKLVAAHDGEIEFDSEPGRTTFRVRLPVARSEAQPREVQPREVQPRSGARL